MGRDEFIRHYKEYSRHDIDEIIENHPELIKFKEGWLNRINTF